MVMVYVMRAIETVFIHNRKVPVPRPSRHTMISRGINNMIYNESCLLWAFDRRHYADL